LNGPHSIFMLAALFAAVGMWWMLPGGSARARAAGAVLGTASLGMFLALVPRLGDWPAEGVFFILAGVTVIAAAATVTLRNPVYSAIWFGLTLLGTAGLFLFQGAQFLAVATVVVYAGAILVMFLFVLMLAQPQGRAPYDRISWEALVSAASGAVMVGILSMIVTGVLTDSPAYRDYIAMTPDEREQHHQQVHELLKTNVLAEEHVASIGAELFGGHLIAVEVAGTLLLAALVGAAVIVAQTRASVSPPGGGSQTDDGRQEALER